MLTMFFCCGREKIYSFLPIKLVLNITKNTNVLPFRAVHLTSCKGLSDWWVAAALCRPLESTQYWTVWPITLNWSWTRSQRHCPPRSAPPIGQPAFVCKAEKNLICLSLPNHGCVCKQKKKTKFHVLLPLCLKCSCGSNTPFPKWVCFGGSRHVAPGLFRGRHEATETVAQ